MPELVWDKVGDRVYETGLDKGVLYLPDGSAVPWNGLTAIIEQFDKEVIPIYYDGMKIHELVVLGDFKASMKAVTYPDEFIELEGLGSLKRGTFFGDQRPQSFGLCYRTQVGNDLAGDVAGYKIHIVYNVTAIPSDKTYTSITADPSLVEFEWNITAVPEEIPGLRPTAHIIIDSRDVDPWLLEELEDILYGTTVKSAILLPMSELAARINNFCRVKVVDHGDGTWSAIADRSGFISLDFGQGLFTIAMINAVYLNETTFMLSDTCDARDVPQIKITDNNDGTWTAMTDQDNLIVVTNGSEFEIRNANAQYVTPDSYTITDTVETN